MKKYSKVRKVFSLFLCFFLLSGIIPATVFEAYAAQSSDVWFLRGYAGSDYNTTHYDINYANKGHLGLTGIFTLETIDNRLAYCVDPGTQGAGTTGDDVVLYDNEDSYSAFANKMSGKLSSNAAGLTTRQIYDLLRVALAYGFQSNSNPASWGELVEGAGSHPRYFIRLNRGDPESIFRAIATQIIIQEITSGERNTDFSHYGNVYLHNQQLGTASNPRTSFYNQIDGYYNDYVSQITNAIANRNKTPVTTNLPTEYFTHSAGSVDGTSFNLGTIELKLNADGTVSGEKTFSELGNLVNGSGSESAKTIETSLPGVSISGNTVRVSMPYRTAINYQNKTFSVKVTKTSQKTETELKNSGSPQAYSYKYASNITLYTGSGLQYKTCVTGDSVTKTNYVQNKELHTYHHTYNYEYTLNVKVPAVHTHKWLPHVTAPTCTTEGLTEYFCTCGVIYTFSNGVSDSITSTPLPNGGVTEALGHDYSGEWVTNIQPTCTTDGEEKQICRRCGIVIGTRTVAATGHDAGIWVITAQPTVTADGEKSLVCTKCGAVMATEPVSRHNHVPGEEVVLRAATCTTVGLKGRLCTVCSACCESTEIPCGHSVNTVRYTNVSATCTSGGEDYVLCADCGATIGTVATAPLGHADSVEMTGIEPTCTTAGEMLSYCTRCGEVTDSREIPSLGHSDGIKTVSVDATCELPGEEICICSRCGEVTGSRSIDKLGHDEEGVWKIDIPATADHTGSMSEYCTRCGMVLDTKSFSLHDHEFGYSAVLLRATCTTGGEKGSVCKKCNAVYEVEAVPVTGHSYQDSYFTNGNGTHSKVCLNCNHLFTENCSFTVTADIAATCTATGSKTYRCSDCGYTYTGNYTQAYGHNFGKWTSDGVGSSTHTRYCTNPGCGVYEQHLHTWSEYVFTEDATVDHGIIRTRTCMECGEKQSVEGEDTFEVIIAKGVGKVAHFLDILKRIASIFAHIMNIFSRVASAL